MVGGLGPSERLGIVVDGLDVVPDCLFELPGRMVHAAANLLFGELGKEPLDLVDPRRRSWREVNLPAWMSGQPSTNGWSFVSGVVVHHQMDIEIGRNVALDLA